WLKPPKRAAFLGTAIRRRRPAPLRGLRSTGVPLQLLLERGDDEFHDRRLDLDTVEPHLAVERLRDTGRELHPDLARTFSHDYLLRHESGTAPTRSPPCAARRLLLGRVRLECSPDGHAVLKAGPISTVSGVVAYDSAWQGRCKAAGMTGAAPAA